VSQKHYTENLAITLANVDQFLKFFSWQITRDIAYISVVEISTSAALLYYLVKFDNSK